MFFLKDELAEEVLGDLDQNFIEVAKERSLFRAKLNYWFQVINYLRPFALRKIYLTFLSMTMLQSYVVISRRTLIKQKLYAFINIAGLSIGLASFLIIMLYVQHEFSYNRFYPGADNIYRVFQKQDGNDFMGSDFFSVTPGKLASVMRDELPEVKNATSVEQSQGLLSFENEHFFKQGLAADGEFFRVFPFDVLEGNLATALNDPRAIILTESLAKAIFKNESPIGKTLKYQDNDGFHVTAVISDAPSASSLKYSFIINILYNDYYREEIERAVWNGNGFYTFFKLDAEANPRELEKKFPALIQRYRDPVAYKDYSFHDTYFVQPISEIYFQQGINFDIGLKGNKSVVYAFLVAAFIVLFLACVNYMNLAIARSIKRAREVGVRKVAGAMKSQIIFQFLTESVLIAFISLILAIGLTYLCLPFFATIMERPVEFNIFSNPYVLPGLLILVLVIGFISGSYPAFVMSSLRPVLVLKGKANISVSRFTLQRILVVGQFVASITLIIVSLLIHRQIEFVREKDLGYDKSNVITIFLNDFSLRKKFTMLQHEWMQNPQIISATVTSHLPANINSSGLASKFPGENQKDQFAIYQWIAEYDFTKVFGLKLVSGRSFSRDITTDPEHGCLINETAAKAFGWTPADAVGREVYVGDQLKIVGVINDFHLHSMHLPIEPLVVRVSETRGNFFSVKVRPEKMPETIAYLEKTIRSQTSYPFQYEFLDDAYDKLYKSEMKLGDIFSFFTFVSVLIAALGLFGLAAFMGEQRTKEIGIRKVLGASINSIMVLLSRELVMLVLLAILLAVPVSWYMTHLWLQDFAYKMEIEWWVFVLAGVVSLGIAYASIGYQSFKASRINPVESLKE